MWPCSEDVALAERQAALGQGTSGAQPFLAVGPPPLPTWRRAATGRLHRAATPGGYTGRLHRAATPSYTGRLHRAATPGGYTGRLHRAATPGNRPKPPLLRPWLVRRQRRRSGDCDRGWLRLWLVAPVAGALLRGWPCVPGHCGLGGGFSRRTETCRRDMDLVHLLPNCS
jgi:hypothetical protein